MTTRGLLPGAFLPPHQGHLMVAQIALTLCDHLTVLVLTAPGDPIPADTRTAWLRELLPRAQVVAHPAAALGDAADDWRGWRAALAELCPGRIDHLYGSNLPLSRLADAFGAEPVVIDPQRLAVPVTSRAIRANPAPHWRWLPAPVRRHYQRRVTLFGAESTGKSTLVARLAARHRTPYMPEYGRVYELYRQIGPYRPGELAALARRHVAQRTALSPLAGPILFEDTDALTTAVWARMMGQHEPTLEAAPLADLYLVMSPDAPFVQDGVRYFDGAARERFHQTGLDLLDARGARRVVLRGDWAAREAAALRAIAGMDAKGPGEAGHGDGGGDA